MCILLLFNGALTLSYQEIKDATNIQPDDQLRRHLISLCTKKHRILQKTSKGKHITGEHALGLRLKLRADEDLAAHFCVQTTMCSLSTQILSPSSIVYAFQWLRARRLRAQQWFLRPSKKIDVI